MKIINATKGITLAEQVILADSFFMRLKGLLGRKDFTGRQALIIRPCNSIHTFFMRFPIDVLFVDKDNNVIAVLSALPAFRISKIYFQSAFVIELPAGTLKDSLTSAGDLVNFAN